MKGCQFCFVHNPERAAQAEAARVRGGKHSKNRDNLRGIQPPSSAGEVRDLSARIVAAVLNGTLEARTARLALLACRTFLTALTTESLVPWQKRSSSEPMPDADRTEQILRELSESN